MVYADDVSGFTSYSFKPQLKTLGPKYGKLIGTIKNALSELDGSAAYTGLKAEGKLSLNVEGSDIELSEDDLLIESVKKEGYVTKEDNLMTVVLDVNLTPELIEEGYVNEIISKVQNMRKDSGFEVMDHIRISINGNDKLYDIVMKNAEDIKRKVLAESISKGESFKNSGDWNINGEDVTITLEKI